MVGLAFTVVAIVLVWAAMPAVGRPGPGAFARSLDARLGTPRVAVHGCHRSGDRQLECTAFVPLGLGPSSGPDDAVYRLRVDGRRCWAATVVRSDHYSGARRASGCVALRHQLRARFKSLRPTGT